MVMPSRALSQPAQLAVLERESVCLRQRATTLFKPGRALGSHAATNGFIVKFELVVRKNLLPTPRHSLVNEIRRPAGYSVSMTS